MATSTSYTGTNLNNLKSGLDTALDTLQSAVDGQALGNSLPLLGNTLKGNKATQIITQLKTAFDSELVGLSNPTTDDIKKALTTAAKNLGVLKGDLQEVDSGTQVEYVLKLGQDPVNVSTPLAADIGLPKLGLKVSGNADTKIGYDFTLGFGLDKDKGFFLDTSQNPLHLKLDVSTPGLAAEASLGFLKFNAKDNTKDGGTKFNGDFAISLKNADPSKQLFLSNLTNIGTSPSLSLSER